MGNKKFDFLNVEKDLGYIKFNISGLDESNVNYIFAKNGTGKTTFSREVKNISNDSMLKFIFNYDYIENNIYTTNVSNENEQSRLNISEKHKNNTFKIMFGENIHEIQREIENLESETKKLKDKIEEKLNSKKFSKANFLNDEYWEKNKIIFKNLVKLKE